MQSSQEFVKSVNSFSEIPKFQLPEIVLCGRSNVGKSSFINSLFNKKNLAKISSTPGKTRSLNFYLIDKKYYLVDMPGFGYAKISKTEKLRWANIINEYLNNSKNILAVFHLIDARHEPTKLDIDLHSFIKSLGINLLTVLTKIDKLKQSEIALQKKEIVKFFPELINNDNYFLYSSITGLGKNEVLKKIKSLFII
ncbi:MAG: YihA family ribosome biogenesis GTP-binding protein [Chlorobiaceae bacterium]|nr:YihA family ribosome biogenesis GTP-binding protein [Chlorobiaceae bacterium]MBA4310124.1 YihA family ribosome biogenesis GTP-binding protein [Chlorobiaceae bacterium]